MVAQINLGETAVMWCRRSSRTSTYPPTCRVRISFIANYRDVDPNRSTVRHPVFFLKTELGPFNSSPNLLRMGFGCSACLTLGRIAIRPYDVDDAVKIIRHHHEFTTIDFRPDFRRSRYKLQW